MHMEDWSVAYQDEHALAIFALSSLLLIAVRRRKRLVYCCHGDGCVLWPCRGVLQRDNFFSQKRSHMTFEMQRRQDTSASVTGRLAKGKYGEARRGARANGKAPRGRAGDGERQMRSACCWPNAIAGTCMVRVGRTRGPARMEVACLRWLRPVFGKEPCAQSRDDAHGSILNMV